MHESLKPASIAGAKFDKYFHTCAFFGSRAEEYRIISPFITEGLEGGEKAIYIVDPAILPEHAGRLAEAGVPCAAHSKDLDIVTWTDTYLLNGKFDMEFMLSTVKEVIRTGREQGYPRSRIVGQMGWALQPFPGVEQLIEYEVRVNDVLAREQHPAICVYDVNKLTGSMMTDLLRTHPLTIIGGTLYENPFYRPAEEMLSDLRSRHLAQA